MWQALIHADQLRLSLWPQDVVASVCQRTMNYKSAQNACAGYLSGKQPATAG